MKAESICSHFKISQTWTKGSKVLTTEYEDDTQALASLSITHYHFLHRDCCLSAKGEIRHSFVTITSKHCNYNGTLDWELVYV